MVGEVQVVAPERFVDPWWHSDQGWAVDVVADCRTGRRRRDRTLRKPLHQPRSALEPDQYDQRQRPHPFVSNLIPLTNYTENRINQLFCITRCDSSESQSPSLHQPNSLAPLG